MIRNFKFFNKVLVYAHDGGEIYCDQFFFTVNKIDLPRINGQVLPKYTIVRRVVSSLSFDRFVPDHETLWYFSSKENAEWLVTIWKRQDELLEQLERRRTL